MQKITPLARKNNLVVQELDNEILIYDLETNKVFGLNETSALVWQFSDGNRNISEIAQIVGKKLSYPIQEDFIWLALEHLKKVHLLENDWEIPALFEGATRREVIKRIGLASMVALPVISSIIAPISAQAQSSSCGASPFALGCTCNNSSLCTSGCCNFPAGGSGVCVPMNVTANGGSCEMGCFCVSTCCSSEMTCISPNSKPAGSPCTFSCECVSGTVCTGFFPNTMCA